MGKPIVLNWEEEKPGSVVCSCGAEHLFFISGRLAPFRACGLPWIRLPHGVFGAREYPYGPAGSNGNAGTAAVKPIVWRDTGPAGKAAGKTKQQAAGFARTSHFGEAAWRRLHVFSCQR